MLLSDVGLRQAIADGSLEISHFDDRLVQPASIDLRLGSELLTQPMTLDWMTQNPHYGSREMDSYLLNCQGFYTLRPGEFVLGHTLEIIGLDASLAARLEGKSSLGRMGLAVHSTAGFIDPGFRGQITLELSNISNCSIELTCQMPISQLCVMRLESPAQRPYGSHGLGSRYQGQLGATPSRGSK